MKKYLIILIAVVSMSIFTGCEADEEFTQLNYVTFETGSLNAGVEVGGTATYDVTVYTANITDSDRQFAVNADASSTLSSEGYTIPSSVTIPGGSNEGVISVQVSDVDLGVIGKTLQLSLQSEPDLSVGKPIKINVARTCVGKEFVVDFVFDGYASETSWSLTDDTGAVLVEQGGYSDDTPTASKSLCLSQGTYTFTVIDAYGDGLTYPNLGSVTLSYAGNELAVIPGDFGAETSVEVTF